MRNRVTLQANLKYFFLAIFFVIFFLTAGYAAFSANFTITDSVAYIRSNDNTRIIGIASDSAHVTNLEFSASNIFCDANIPNGGTVTFQVTVDTLGNVPKALSSISVSSSGSILNNVSISPSLSGNYIKICDSNDSCTLNASKVIDITVTNNTGSAINTDNFNVNLSLDPYYTISYNGNVLGDALHGKNFTYTFSSNAPAMLKVATGSYASYNYSGNTIIVYDVTSDLTLSDAYTVTYDNTVIAEVLPGSNATYTFSDAIPLTVNISGTYSNMSYNRPNLLISGVNSDLVVSATFGVLSITDIQYVSSVNVETYSTPTFSGMTATFNVKFRRPEGSTVTDFRIVYEIELTNDDYRDYTFRGFDFTPLINSYASSDAAVMHLDLDGISNGYVIPAFTKKTFNLILWLETSNPDGSYSTEVGTGANTTETVETEEGELITAISPSTGDLRDPKEYATFTMTVNNTYPTDKTFTLVSTNSNLLLVDTSGNDLGSFTVASEDTETITFCIKTHQLAAFLDTTDTLSIQLSPVGLSNVTAGTLTLSVDKFEGVDNDKVVVSSATIAIHRASASSPPTVGRIDASWHRDDEGGTSVRDYTVILYRSDGTSVTTGHTNSAVTNYTFTNAADGSYYIVVYGVDENTSGASDVATATTAAGYATKSATQSFKWRYTVDLSGITNMTTGGGGNVAYAEANYTLTVSAPSGYYAPEDLTVRKIVGNRTTTLANNTNYTYTRSSNSSVGTFTISNVTFDMSISGSPVDSSGGGCFIEGTKILLADGTYKNIENIGYDDLILVYSHDTGEFVGEYPIWVEKGKITDRYLRTTFSDGTVLETFDDHGVFDVDLNLYISVNNRKEFKVGNRVVKVNPVTRKFETVTVTSIETIYEDAAYYQVVTTRYFNMVANNLLTTDGHIILSNLYGFTENMTWNKEVREYAIQDVYTYEELSDVIPLYMYKGTRAGEAKVLSQYGYGLSKFKELISLINNENTMYLPPIQLLNTNLWMVTTSEDNVNSINKKLYLRPEGSTYTLPKSNNDHFVAWLNTGDNTLYYPGDAVMVYYGTHFEAIYDE